MLLLAQLEESAMSFKLGDKWFLQQAEAHVAIRQPWEIGDALLRVHDASYLS